MMVMPFLCPKRKKPEHLIPEGTRWSGANANNNDLMVRPILSRDILPCIYISERRAKIISPLFTAS